MSQLINIFLEPGKVFAQLKEKPTFLAPVLVILAFAILSAMLYHFNVDAEWFMNHQIQVLAQEMTASELEQVKPFLPGAQASAYIAAPIILVTMSVIFALFALYYMLAGRVSGNPTSFRHGLSLVAWSSMPMVLASLISIIAVYTSSPQSTFESMQLLSIDPLFVQLEVGHPWATLARMLSLIYLWVWFLAALGWKTWYRTSWGQALFVVLLPNVLVFGGMALFAAF